MLFAPPERRIEQVRRAEALHDAIDPAATYPLDFLVHRITGYHPERDADMLLVGEALLPDLRLMIDTVSRSVGMPAEEDEIVETPEQLAARLRISTKTLSRWRDLGLRWRWAKLPEESRKRLVFCRSAVQRFLEAHGDRVEKAAAFTKVDDATRQQVLRRARRIAESADVSMNQVATHLARRLGRAVETVRQILEKHDRAHPDDPIFTDRTGPLTPNQRRVIARAYRIGIPVSRIARRFSRTRSTIYRVVHEQRAARLRQIDIRWVHLSVFERDDADEVLLHASPAAIVPIKPDREHPAAVDTPAARRIALPDVLEPLFNQTTWSPSEHRSMIVRMNYLKFKAAHLREALDRHEPRMAQMDEIERCLVQSQQIRSRLVQSALPLIVNVARQHLIDHADRARSEPMLLTLLLDGLPIAIDTIDHHNPARGGTLRHALSWALMRRFVVHTGTDSASPQRRRAQRRRTPEQVLEQLRRIAQDRGVALPEPSGP